MDVTIDSSVEKARNDAYNHDDDITIKLSWNQPNHPIQFEPKQGTFKAGGQRRQPLLWASAWPRGCIERRKAARRKLRTDEADRSEKRC